jgi:cellulose synthase/poly-beta-1,6-N-acetylglucosamine synthase-like glycosyltransferase
MGLNALGVPCLLMGTGMAFPWPVIVRSDLETGHLVEDMVLGLELAARGDCPRFLPEACVRSALPPSLEGQKSQRTRWETGHLQVIRQYVPQLMRQAAARADYRLLALALHAAVPPLALLVAMLLVTTCANGLVALAGGPALGFKLSGLATCAAGLVFTVYWITAGRDLLSFRELLSVPGYAVSKLSIYKRALSGKRIEWVRSKRD